MTNGALPTAEPVPGSGHPVLRSLGVVLGAIVALFLVGRGVAEFFIVNYSDPASYHNSWGGPSLAGVFAVHSGPAVVIVAGTVLAIRRRVRARREIVRH